MCKFSLRCVPSVVSGACNLRVVLVTNRVRCLNRLCRCLAKRPRVCINGYNLCRIRINGSGCKLLGRCLLIVACKCLSGCKVVSMVNYIRSKVFLVSTFRCSKALVTRSWVTSICVLLALVMWTLVTLPTPGLSIVPSRSIICMPRFRQAVPQKCVSVGQLLACGALGGGFGRPLQLETSPRRTLPIRQQTCLVSLQVKALSVIHGILVSRSLLCRDRLVVTACVEVSKAWLHVALVVVWLP